MSADTIEPIYTDHWHFDKPFYLFSTGENLALSAGNHIGFFSTDAGDLELQKLYALEKGHILDYTAGGFYVDADTVWAGMTHAGMSKYILSDSPLARLNWSYEIFDDSFYDVRKSGSSIIYGKGLFIPKIISLSISGPEPLFADTLFGNMSHRSWDVSGDLLAVTDVDSVYLYRVTENGTFVPEFSLHLEHNSPGWRVRFGDDCLVVMHVDGDLSFYTIREGIEQGATLEIRSVLDTRRNYGELDLHDTQVYVAGNGAIQIVDIAELSSPAILKTIKSDYLYDVEQLVYHDGDAYALRSLSHSPEKFLRVTLSEPSPEVENLSPRWAGRVQTLAQYGDNVIVFPDGDSVYVHDSDEPWKRKGYDLGLDSVRHAEVRDDLVYLLRDEATFMEVLSVEDDVPSVHTDYIFPDEYRLTNAYYDYTTFGLADTDRLAVRLSTESLLSQRYGIFDAQDPHNISLTGYLPSSSVQFAISNDGNTLISLSIISGHSKAYAYDITSFPEEVVTDTLTILPEELREVENRTLFGQIISHDKYWYITCTPSQTYNFPGYLCILSQSPSNEFVMVNMIYIDDYIPIYLTIKDNILIGSNSSVYIWDIEDPVNPILLLKVPDIGAASRTVLDKNGYLHVGDRYSYVVYEVHAYLPERFLSNMTNHVEMKIWPNPTNQSVSFTTHNLQSDIIDVSIYNILGQLVNRVKMKNYDVNTLYFPARIQSGLYFIETGVPGQKVQGKVIIIR